MSQGPAPVGLVGRERDLAVLDDLLARDGPSLLLVAAPVGMGKTSLLQALQARAAMAQRQVLPAPGEQPLIAPETTPRSFAERLGRRLDELVPSAFSGTDPDSGSSASAGARTVGARLEDPATVLVRKLGRVAGIASLLLVVDDYWPSPDFARWFTDRLLPSLLSEEGGRIVVAVAASRDKDVEVLSRRATKVLKLRPLSTRAVAAHFRRIGRRLQPPLTPVELDVYARAAREQPQLLGPLTRTLLLASPPGTTEVGP